MGPPTPYPGYPTGFYPFFKSRRKKEREQYFDAKEIE